MRFDFTPAAERALLAAAGWTSCDDCDELHVPEVLLGLLAEAGVPRRLAAGSTRNRSKRLVRRRFADLTPRWQPDAGRASRFSALVAGLPAHGRTAADRISSPAGPGHRTFAAGHRRHAPAKSSAWLDECGLDVEALEAEMHRLSGHVSPGPLPFEPRRTNRSSIVGDDRPSPVGRRARRDQREHAARGRRADYRRGGQSGGRGIAGDRGLPAIRARRSAPDRTAKQIRHELTAALATFSPTERHRARETQADVGTDVSSAAEQARATATRGRGGQLQACRAVAAEPGRILQDARPERGRDRWSNFVTACTRSNGPSTSRAQQFERLAEARLYVLVEWSSSGGVSQLGDRS